MRQTFLYPGPSLGYIAELALLSSRFCHLALGHDVLFSCLYNDDALADLSFFN